ncbi:crossover junction endodeoxyribonuclease RuvC [Mycetocola spongiae]|uniref:crossover junction endodeoxyribonuclease RuvC n=1 Tax=Mycetocola spongiae TaxID=2859226 RepID=UPI001CF5B8AC|nr:crossover junction endodeoxyribonuclease RuvC [Mycetocola spongiae]UCR89565.1 crossover junction endodeoxyribonuclease RuvC [Mycetocola spongiae]
MGTRVLGVDPGLTRCGIGVVDVAPNRRATLVFYGVIRTSPDLGIDRRLLLIAEGLEEAILTHRPTAMAVERVFAQQNLSTVMGTAQASGLALYSAAKHGIPIGMHTPSEVKAAVTGYGNAEKKQVQTMVARVLGMPELPQPADAADALALAICHAWGGSVPVGKAPHGSRSTSTMPAGALTPAQQAWQRAEQASRRPGR